MRKPGYAVWITFGPVLLFLAVGAVAIAGSVSTPHAFTPGTVADANQVNENFEACATAINDNDTRIGANVVAIHTNQTNTSGNAAAIGALGSRVTTNEADIDTNAVDCATNATGITTNATDCATNATDCATNATDIATNATDILANETDIVANESDITGHETRISTIENGTPVSGLDADELDGFHANELVRATYTSTTTGVDDWYYTTNQTLLSKSVTVPASGILLIWASTEASWDLDSTAGTYSWLQTSVTVGGTAVGHTCITEFFDNEIGLDMKTAPLYVAAPVSAGTSTVALQGRIYSGSAYLYLGPRSLTTLFVPFGNAGTQGTLSPTAPGAPGAPGSPADPTPAWPPVVNR